MASSVTRRAVIGASATAVTVPFAVSFTGVPGVTNPSSTTVSTAATAPPPVALGAYINAVCDALAELGVEHVEMPATAQNVWKAIRAARRG